MPPTPTPRQRVFISSKFGSGSERDAVVDRAIRTALRRQGMVVRSISLSVGQQITDACRSHIDRSDAFVAIVSERSAKSEYCRDEVRHAAARAPGKLPIFALLLDGESIEESGPANTEPFNRLAGHVWLIAGEMTPEDIGRRLAASVCQHLSVPFVEPVDHPNSPVRARMWSEMLLVVSEEDRKLQEFTDAYDRASEASARFHLAYRPPDGGTPNLATASAEMTQVIANAEQIAPSGSLYYPRLLLAVLELDRADVAATREQRLRHIGNAEELLSALLERAEGSTLPWDEGMLAAAGVAASKRGHYSEAVELFQRARSAGDPEDAAVLYHTVVNAMRIDRSDSEFFDTLNLPLSFWDVSRPLRVGDPSDVVRQRLLLASAHAHLSRSEDAIRVYDALDEESVSGHEDLVFLVADRLRAGAERQSDGDSPPQVLRLALRVIERATRVTLGPRTEAWHHLRAQTLFELERHDQAVAAYDTLLAYDGTRATFLVERGLLYEVSGKKQLAARCYRSALKERPLEGRHARDELLYPSEQYRSRREYAKGYAVWRLGGSVKEAEDHYRESGQHGEYGLRRYADADRRLGLPPPKRGLLSALFRALWAAGSSS